MLSLILIQLLVFVAYTSFIVSRYGVIHSISQSWYELPLKWKSLFTFFTWGLGIPFLFYDHVLFFLAGAGLIFVGAATRFRTTIANTNRIHYMGALVGILSSLLALGVVYGSWVSLVIFIITSGVIFLLNRSHYIFWVEIAAFVVIIISLFTHAL